MSTSPLNSIKTIQHNTKICIVHNVGQLAESEATKKKGV